MKQQRRHFSAQQKVQMLRQHLVEKVSISEVCDQNGISPTQFYQWQKVFFECGTAAFEKAGNGRKDSQVKTLERQNAHLQAKLVRKDEVIAEIMASHVALKKILARIERRLGRAGCPGRGGRLRAVLVRQNRNQGEADDSLDWHYAE